jgi:hypothetical protein
MKITCEANKRGSRQHEQNPWNASKPGLSKPDVNTYEMTRDTDASCINNLITQIVVLILWATLELVLKLYPLSRKTNSPAQKCLFGNKVFHIA